MDSEYSSTTAGPLSDAAVVLDSVDAAIITIDTIGTILEINRATERLFKYKEVELVAKNIKILMPTPHRDEHDTYLANHLKTKKTSIIGVGRQVVGLRSDQTTFPIHLAVGKHTTNGKTLYTGIIHDLSHQVARTEDSTRLGQILDESLNEIFAFDAHSFKFSMISRGALSNLGYTRDEALSMTPVDIKPDHTIESFKKLINPLLDGSKLRILFSTRHKRKDGTLYDVNVSLTLSNAAPSTPEFVAIVDDVTEKNRMLKMMHQSQKLEAIGQLTGGIAHDFNNLLTVISGNLELLEPVVSTALHQDILKDARDAANMGARLTNRLLAFASQSSLTPNTVNINKLVLEMIELVRRTIGDNISLETNLTSNLWTTKVDISQLENSLLNLAINSRDAMPEGGRLSIGTKNMTITNLDKASEQALLGDFVQITVSDTGQGIDAENIGEIFEPFYTTKQEKLGTGLGLSMVYGFVRQSGGFIDVKSAPNQKTEFALHVPRVLSELDNRSSVINTIQNDPKLPKTILIVEDEDSVRKLTRRRLEKLGHNVIEASDGYEALTLFNRTDGIDIVFSDMVMSAGMSGYDLAKAIFTSHPTVAFLLTSGYATELIDSDKLEVLGVSLLKKPYTIDDLELHISRL